MSSLANEERTDPPAPDYEHSGDYVCRLVDDREVGGLEIRDEEADEEEEAWIFAVFPEDVRL